MRDSLALAMRPAHMALSVLMGDFNWVAHPEDRWHKADGRYTGYRDARDETHFQTTLARPFALHELRQPAATHDNAHARSRLDRVYWNQPLSEQLDRLILCTALEWVPHLSAHRAVAFSRSRPLRSPDSSRPLDLSLLRPPAWAERVACLLPPPASPPAPGDALRRLHEAKRAMRRVTEEMAAERAARQADRPDPEDALGQTMRFIRAAEGGFVGAMRRCLAAYPSLKLRSLIWGSIFLIWDLTFFFI